MAPRCLHYLIPIIGVIIAAIWLHESDSTIKGTYIEGKDSFKMTHQNQTKLAGDSDYSPQRVSIPNCPDLSFEVLPYDKLGLDNDAEFLDFAIPTKLSASYSRYKEPLCGFPGNPWGYGRHHIYPLSWLANFIGFLSNFPELYDGQNFCSWIEKELVQEENPLKYRFTTFLQNCLPHNEQSVPHYMPWLESTASSIKGKVFNGRSVISRDTFKDYKSEMQVYYLRATMGIFSYMTEEKTKTELEFNTGCVRSMWGLWYSNYRDTVLSFLFSFILDTF
jgi:hypothetical protein